MRFDKGKFVQKFCRAKSRTWVGKQKNKITFPFLHLVGHSSYTMECIQFSHVAMIIPSSLRMSTFFFSINWTKAIVENHRHLSFSGSFSLFLFSQSFNDLICYDCVNHKNCAEELSVLEKDKNILKNIITIQT